MRWTENRPSSRRRACFRLPSRLGCCTKDTCDDGAANRLRLPCSISAIVDMQQLGATTAHQFSLP
jgi:hypothetical protein